MRHVRSLLTVLLAALPHAACGEDPVPTPPSTASAGGGDPSLGTGGAGGSGAGGAGGDAGSGGSTPAACSSSVETDDYAPGLTKVGDNGYTVVLVQSDPAPPVEGDNAWTVRVLAPDGTAQSGLAIDVYPFMPDHNHGTAVKAIVTPAGSDGIYEIAPIHLFMSGVWTVRLKLLDPVSAAELDHVKYAFCVRP